MKYVQCSKQTWLLDLFGSIELEDADYDQAAAASRKELGSEEAMELKALWKKLVRLYHPDRFANQPDKLETYYHLTSAINQARENGDIAGLRDIANDPHGFILRAGWASLDFGDAGEVRSLRRLLDTLQLEILTTLDSLNELHESPECMDARIKGCALAAIMYGRLAYT